MFSGHFPYTAKISREKQQQSIKIMFDYILESWDIFSYPAVLILLSRILSIDLVVFSLLSLIALSGKGYIFT